MKKLLSPALGVLAFAGIGFGVIKAKEANDALARAQQAEKELEEARAKFNARAGEISELREKNAFLTRARDEAIARGKQRGGGSSDTAKNETPGALDPKQQMDIRGMISGFSRAMDDPETRKLMLKEGTERALKDYEVVFKKMGLSEDDAKLAANLISERNFTLMDKARRALSGKPGDEPAVIIAEVQASKADFDKKLSSVVGADKFTELNAYERTRGDQRALDGVARSFERKGTPLQDTQRTALADVMREERLKQPSNELPDMGGGPGLAALLPEADLKAREEAEAAYQQRVIDRAPQAGLSPDQVSELQSSFQRTNQQRALGARMGRAFLGGMNGTPAPAPAPAPAQ